MASESTEGSIFMDKQASLKLLTGKSIGIYKNEASDALYLYGPVGDIFDEECITATGVRKALEGIQSTALDIHLHSYGGDAFDGIAVYNILKQSAKTITLYVDGMAASAASIIAMAGDKIFMPKNTQLMIHNAATGLFGNAKDFESVAKQLESVNHSLRETYLERFNGTEKELIQFMADEKSFSAKEALDWGLIDEVLNYDSTPIAEKETVDNQSKPIVNKKTVELSEKILQQREKRFAAFVNALSNVFGNGGK